MLDMDDSKLDQYQNRNKPHTKLQPPQIQISEIKIDI
jgi:hypothetical protein